MKSLIQATVFLAASTLAFVIPPEHHPAHGSVDGKSVAGSTGFDGISVLFSTPCQHCFQDAHEELDIEFRIDASASACQPSSVTINDVKLASHPSVVLFNAKTASSRHTQQVVASWELSCLSDDVSLLSFQIKEVGSKQVEHKIGFSASFKQGNEPHFLRLEHVPADDAINGGHDQHWTTAQKDANFVIVSTPFVIDSELPDELQEELRRLHEIKAHLGRLRHKYMRQERRVFHMITDDFHTCQGAACFVQTAIKKAPDLFELVKTHFRGHPDWSKIKGHPFKDLKNSHRQELRMFSHPPDLDELPFPSPFDGPDADDLPHSPPPHHDEEDHPHRHHDGPPKPPHHNKDGPHRHHDGPPPPHPHHDEDGPRRHHDGPRPPHPHHDEDAPHRHHDGPPPTPEHHRHEGSGHKKGKHPPWAGHRHSHHHKHHFLHRHGPHRHPLVFSVGSLLFFVIVSSLLFKCVRAKTGLFRSIQRKQDRAARREEFCTRAAYRSAAMRHKWRRWWSQFRQPQSTYDYEEKRERILNQENNLENVMQSEINDLRRAHEMVGDLMRAEERRQTLYHEANFGNSSSQGYSESPLNSPNLQSVQTTYPTSTLDEAPPPSYDQELEGEITVVDGFLYTPSNTDSTPASSVIECDPKVSFETSTTRMK